MVLDLAEVTETRKSAFVILEVPFLGEITGSLIQNIGSYSRRFRLTGIIVPNREMNKAAIEDYFKTGRLILTIPGIGSVNVVIESLSLREEEGDILSYSYDLKLMEV